MKKFLSTFAYAKPKVEKKVQSLELLTAQNSQNPSSGLCGAKTSNLCLILFLNGKGEALIEQYKPLAEQFVNDPVSLTYVYTKDEPGLAK
jgi:hypothetical protein